MYSSHIFWLLTFVLVTPMTLQADSNAQVPPGLREAYQQVRQQIEVIEEKGKPIRWHAVNAGNHLNVDFDGKGIEASSPKDDWSLSMELTQLGAVGQLKSANKPSTHIKDNRLTYDRGNIKEWYINDPKGLEQGFTLDKPLAKEQLVLQFALGGDVKPTLIEQGKVLQLTTPKGKKLRYEGLKAWDANGKDLHAVLRLKGDTLQLQVAVLNAAYPVTIDPWLVEDQKLKASDATEGDGFNYSVAVSGDTAVVGVPWDDDGGNFSGSAYVFIHNGTTWIEQTKLTPPMPAADDFFGNSVAIDGDTAVVSGGGAVYVFIRSGIAWIQQSKLTTSSGSDLKAVGIDGDTIVAGAFGEDNVGTDSGSAYVFLRSETNWSEQAKLVAMDAAALQRFGESVAISGETIVVGATWEYHHLEMDTNAPGSAYVFLRNNAAWSQQAKLMASEDSHGDNFGISTAISGDTIVVGAPTEEGNPPWVYIFFRSGTLWSEQAKFTLPAPGLFFGESVAISGDTALVGYPQEGASLLTPTDVYGATYVYTRSGSSWSKKAKLEASDVQVGHGFGHSVSISSDTAMIGAPGDDEVADSSGAAYMFDLSCNSTDTLPSNQWRQISLPCDPGVNNTVTAVFGDDIPGTYGIDWRLYRYDANGYAALATTDTLSQGEAYWIMQRSGSDAILDMPENSALTPVTNPTGCFATAKGCFEIPLTTQANRVQWNMVGYPFASSESLGNVRVQTDTGVCTSGCDLDTAQSQRIVSNKLWSFNGATFTEVDTSGNLDPWIGYWVTTLQNADGLNPRLLLPKP